MNCPKCDQDHADDKITTPRTIRGVHTDYREHTCRTCGCRFTSIAKIQDIYVYNPVTMQDEPIPHDPYIKTYRDVDLGNIPHPATGSRINVNLEINNSKDYIDHS